MARPTSRVLALLGFLQSGGTRSAAELADRLAVDERTVRRYVDHLLDLDVPVEAVRGRYGGYRLAAGHQMPPLMLDDDEALAVLLGLIAGRRAGLLTASGTASETAAAKIRRMLPERLAGRLDALLGQVAFTGPVREAAAPDAGVLLALADAVRHGRPVRMRYVSGDGRRSDRTMHPYGLVAHAGRWYVRGLDVGRGEERTFRVDRIADPRSLPGAFRPPWVRPGRTCSLRAGPDPVPARGVAARPGDGRGDPHPPPHERGDDRGATGGRVAPGHAARGASRLAAGRAGPARPPVRHRASRRAAGSRGEAR